MRLFLRIERTKANLWPAKTNPSLPSFPAPTYSASQLVLPILCVRCFTQIGNPVIASLSIDVIDL